MDTKVSKSVSKNHLLVVVLSSTLCTFTYGSLVTWSSPIFPRLDTINSDNPFGRIITLTEKSLMSSILFLGATFGPVIAGVMMNRIGRKCTLLNFTGIPLIVGAALFFSNSVILYYVARFIMGIGAGVCLVVMPVYLAEISEPSNRGVVSSSISIAIVLGNLVSYAIGPYISTLSLNILFIIFPSLFVLAYSFCPESPYFSIIKKDRKTAERTLCFLRRRNTLSDVKEEVELIKETVEDDFKNGTNLFYIFTNKKCRRAFLICLVLITFQQFSGIAAILLYVTEIFRASGSDIDSNLSTIIVGVVQIVSCLLSSYFVEKLGRKKLLLLSGIGTFVSEAPLGLYFYLKEKEYNVNCIGWLPVLCLIIYFLVFSLGFGSVVLTLMGELFPSNVKAVATTFLISYMHIMCFLVSLLFSFLSTAIGIGYTFLFFDLFCLLSIFYITFCVFETKGKTFQEIQQQLG